MKDKRFYLKVKGKFWHQNDFHDSLKRNQSMRYRYSVLLPLTQGVDGVQQGSLVPSQGEMLQAKETGREWPLTPQPHHKSPTLRGQELASFTIFGFN